MSLRIEKLFVEYALHPLGLDEKKPRFSWILASEEGNTLQTSCRIRVSFEDGNEVWDSGKQNTSESRGIPYEGEDLLPCTRYLVRVTVWDNHGESCEEDTFFETGFLTGKPFEGARWIGAPRFTVSTRNRGVFILETGFKLDQGKGRAGVVFGANDFRLLDRNKNELGMEGENFIRFEINLDSSTPTLDIYRVGYAPGDRLDVPFSSTPLVNFSGEEKKPLITDENRADFHKLQIQVDGNNAFTYLDDTLVDAVDAQAPFGKIRMGRTLNPRGYNDVNTFPRLNEIGFFAGEGTRAYFTGLFLRNMRLPSREFLRVTPEGGLFELPVENGCFVVENTQVTADPSNTGLPMLRTCIRTAPGKKLAKARLYITSRGIYECMVNGEKITERKLSPGLTQYDHRLDYQTFDLTEYFREGKNGLGVTLASGWWSDSQTFVVKNYNYFGDRESLLAKVVLTYQDGTSESFGTSTRDWKYFGEGPYRYAGLFEGEYYDARREEIYRDYSRWDFDDSEWEAPVEIEPDVIGETRTMPVGFGRSWPEVNRRQPVYLGEYDAPVYVVDEKRAVSVEQTAPGVYLYDLGQEMAGVPRVVLHEKEGTEVILRYGEMLYPRLPEYGENQGKLMVENYRDALSTDFYICSGKGEEVYQPLFTFHGFRYIEISGVKNPPRPEQVTGLLYSSITEFEGSFVSDNALLNRFARNVTWSQKCNFINIPTDCPQRNERMGWAGDTHVFCHTALLNSNLKQFYERNLQAMADLQEENGRYPEIAPVGGGFGGITYECASIFIAWELYCQYGDLRTLRRFYPGMVQYMDYMRDKGMPGKADPAAVGPLGDWLAPAETDLQLLWNAFYYREADLMARISALLGVRERKQEYEDLAGEIQEYWNRTFIDPDTRKTRDMEGNLCDTQCSYALGLEYGVIRDREAAGNHLARRVREKNYTVETGFFGTGLLNQALTDTGHTEEAYRMMLQTEYPSWLYPVTQGATTIWERWNSYTVENGFGGMNSMNSFNHYSLGSVLSWMYQGILGICRSEKSPGFEHFELKPQIGPLGYARGSVATPCGVIRSGWEKRGKKVIYRCQIPVNTRATLTLPDGRVEELGSGHYEFTAQFAGLED